mmetsp:Transcript_1663/g.4674  ORF Transcript_1663/g.4674 Transcript_1663/m.4674 type:complete len:86 (-) Transcript_1663:478-735(-)
MTCASGYASGVLDRARKQASQLMIISQVALDLLEIGSLHQRVGCSRLGGNVCVVLTHGAPNSGAPPELTFAWHHSVHQSTALLSP